MLRMLSAMQRYSVYRVEINGVRLKAYMADSGIKKMLGLMFWDCINKGECMFFGFGGMSRPGIWMSNMLMSIDVIWLDDKLRVVDYAESLQPCGSIWNCRTYYPKSDSMYVIEAPRGFVKLSKIRIGSMAKLGTASARKAAPRIGKS